MIHFDFTVSDVDAENIINAIHNRAVKNDVTKMEYMARTDLTEEQKEKVFNEYNRIVMDKGEGWDELITGLIVKERYKMLIDKNE